MFDVALNVPWYVAYPRFTMGDDSDWAQIRGRKLKIKIAELERLGRKTESIFEGDTSNLQCR